MEHVGRDEEGQRLREGIDEYLYYLQAIGTSAGYKYQVGSGTLPLGSNSLPLYLLPIVVQHPTGSIHVHSYVCVKSTVKYLCGDIIWAPDKYQIPAFLKNSRAYCCLAPPVLIGNVLPKTPLQLLDFIIQRYPHLITMSNQLDNLDL